MPKNWLRSSIKMTGNHTELVLMSVCSSSQFTLQLSLKMRQLHLCVHRFNEDLGSVETARGIHQNQNLVVPVWVYSIYALAQCWMTNLQKSLYIYIHCKCSLVFWPYLLIWSSCLEVWYNKFIFIQYSPPWSMVLKSIISLKPGC